MKKILTIFLAVSFVLSVILTATFSVTADARTAVCTVALSEQNAGTDDYFVAADVTFTSDAEFTAGIFTVEATGFKIDGCTAGECTGGEAPEIYVSPEKSMVLFAGFSESTENDIRSYTKVTLSLKLVLGDGAQPSSGITVSIKNISISNVDEEKYTVADAQATLTAQHIHTPADEWSGDATNHWHVCTSCQEKVDEAAHTFDDGAVTPPTCTADGYTTYTCTVCGYSYKSNEVPAGDHNVGEWIADANGHHRHCADCDQDVDAGEHTYEWVITKEATAEENGLREEVCSVCGYKSGNSEDIIYSQHKPGDINGDGSLNNKDLTRLFQYLSDWDVEVNESALDVNGDGSVNNKDLTRLFQYLSDWDVEIY